MTLTLMCLPYAGAGAGLFRPWQDDPGLPFRVVPVQLPGRDEWFVREPCTTMAEAARECAEQIRRRPAADRTRCSGTASARCSLMRRSGCSPPAETACRSG